MEKTFLIAGLGNPGIQYDNTRHNMGFNTIDVLSKELNINLNKNKHKSLIGDGNFEGIKIILAKPQTYMNLSGEAISQIVNWYKLSLESIIIVYDDIDLPCGKIRIRKSGGPGTHNGMRSIIDHLKSINFTRVRIGIGTPPDEWDLADYVLSKISDDDRKILDGSIKEATKAIIQIIRGI